MTTSIKTLAPKSFLIISIIALLWNLMGTMTFFMEVFITPEALAALPDAESALYENTPLWLHIVFGIAVFGGTLGCVLLLMKKSVALPIFIISLLAVLTQMGYWLLINDVIEVHGAASVVMPLIVTAIAAFLVWYSYNAKGKGWIS